MRILHVNDIAFVASTLVAGLRRAGHDAGLVDPAKPGARIPYPWKVLTFPVRALPAAATVLRIRRSRPDVVHLHYATQALVAFLGGRPWVLHCHGSDVRGLTPASLGGRLVGPLIRRADAVVYSTPDLVDWVRAFRGDAAFLANPIDVQRFTPDGSPEVDVLIAVRADPIKGVDQIIEIVGRVRALRPATTFTIVRHGSAIDRLINAAGPSATVIEPVTHAAMADLFRRHRLQLGQFGLGILSQLELEGMATGVPAVTAFHYGHVYPVPPSLPEAATPARAAASVVGLLKDEGARLALASRLRSWVATNHAADVVVHDLIRLYASIVDNGRESVVNE